MGRTGVVTDSLYLEHRPGEYHPESHHRLEVLYSILQDEDVADRFFQIRPRFCDRMDLQMVHSAAHISRVEETAGKPHGSLDPDTQTSAQSYDVARLAVGGVFEAIDRVIRGDCQNAFAMIRPPGHHAEAHRAMGFCLFNNIALGARYLQKAHSIEKVLIIDWDLHHGNGTQNSFYEDPTVLYFSTHQYPYYPGSGHFKEVGRHRGEGYTINIPLPTGPGNAEFVKVFREILLPVSMAFRPEFVLVSAGFDIDYRDPLGGMKVTPVGFALLTRIVMDIADQCCKGRLVMVLEGGYHLQGLRESGKAVLKELMGQSILTDTDLRTNDSAGPMVAPLIRMIRDQIRPFWKGVFHEDR